jgi:hypothetical protein
LDEGRRSEKWKEHEKAHIEDVSKVFGPKSWGLEFGVDNGDGLFDPTSSLLPTLLHFLLLLLSLVLEGRK